MCKITVFKEVFDYYYDGDITKEQLADLLLMHYETKWGDGVDVNDIKDKDLKMIWKTLRHTVKKSVQNAKDYQDRQKAKKTIKDVKPEEFELPNCQIPNTAHLSPSNSEEVEQPQPTVNNATEAIKIATEEEVQINNNIDNDMGTFIGDFKELNNKTTPNVEEKFDNYSDVLDKLLDDYESIINHTTDIIAKAELSDDIMIVYQAKQAKIKLREISEKLIEEIDKTNFYKYINEKIEIKSKRLQVA